MLQAQKLESKESEQNRKFYSAKYLAERVFFDISLIQIPKSLIVETLKPLIRSGL
jgi:hypothetical protein